jgi:galactose mutarotase-like enzyme
MTMLSLVFADVYMMGGSRRGPGTSTTVVEPRLLTIGSAELSVVVNPHVGGTITSVRHVGLGLTVLGEVPWDAIDAPIASFAASDERHWLTRYSGGWPLLFPNGGDSCTVDGVFHGFHGEASVSPWAWTLHADRIELRRRFFTVPVEMHRELSVEGEVLTVREHLKMTGQRPLAVIWGHHPTFGSDLLAGPVEITSGAKLVTADWAYDPQANSLAPGASGNWPMIQGKRGAVDLSRPDGPLAAMAYLTDFETPWAAIRRLDNAVAVVLSWTADPFACAWLWYELGGTPEAPWYGRGRLIGIEPNTTRSGAGLADALSRGTAFRLHPGEERTAELQLRVFRPSGRIETSSQAG